VAFSPDGTRLAINGWGKKAVTMRDSESGREIFSIPGEGANPPGRFVGFMSFSPDGKRLATSGIGDVIVLDAQTGQELLALKGRMGNTVVYSPDGTCLASASRDESLPLQGGGSAPNYRVRLWSAQSGEVLLTFKGDPLFEYKLAFSPDGKRLAAALEGTRTVKVWDTQTGDELLTFVGHNDNVLSLQFDPTGRRLALAGGSGGVRVFDVDRMLKTPTFNTADDRFNNFDLSPDGTRLAGIKTGAIKLWDAQTGQEIHSFQEPKANQPFAVTISPDGKRLAAGFGANHETKKRHYVAGEVKVWDTRTGQEIVTFKGHTTSVVSLAFSPDSTRLASCGGLSTTPVLLKDQGPGEVKVWDVATGQEKLKLPAEFVYKVAYSPDGKRLATLSLEKLNVWDANSGRELLSLPAKCSTRGSVAFSPDGKQLASTNEVPHDGFRPGHVKLFDSETGKQLLTLQGYGGSYVARIAFSPDGRRLALGGQRAELKLWDTQTGEELLAFDNIGYGGVCFSSDGHRLVTTGAEGLKIFDATPLPEKP
jgi:WD40 repeat protein